MEMKHIVEAAMKRLQASSDATFKKSSSELLTKIFKPKSKPDTEFDFTYIIIDGEPRDIAKELKSSGWKVLPSKGVNAVFLTNTKYPDVKLEVTFAEDLERDEIKRWKVSGDEDDYVTMVSLYPK